jgi:hypothetical protein
LETFNIYGLERHNPWTFLFIFSYFTSEVQRLPFSPQLKILLEHQNSLRINVEKQNLSPCCYTVANFEDRCHKQSRETCYLFCENFKVNSCYICHWLNYVLLNKDKSAVSFCQQVAAWVPDIFCDFYLVKTFGSFRKK